MGLTIFYSGSFRRDQSLHDMINDVIACANENHWRFHVYDWDFPDESCIKEYDHDHRFGISLLPENCESLNLYFDSLRRLGYETDLSRFIIETWVQDTSHDGHWERENLPENLSIIRGEFTKTQYAGADIHIKIIQLLKNLSEKYFSEFVVSDDSGFWDHGDEKLLKERFGEVVV